MCLLLVFVQSGLQQAEGVDQSWGEAALLSWWPSERRSLAQTAAQVEFLMSLFTDQLRLSRRERTG